MNARSVEHATLVIERVYEVSPDRVFGAWSDPAAKAAWYVEPGVELELDFRVGGRERSQGAAPDGRPYAYEALYLDIVPATRIVYTYEMEVDGTKISVSLATAEFEDHGEGATRLVFTEQAAFLDGHETAESRSGGMGSLLDLLGQQLC